MKRSFFTQIACFICIGLLLSIVLTTIVCAANYITFEISNEGYDGIVPNSDGTMNIIEKNGLYGLADSKGNILVTCQYNAYKVTSHDGYTIFYNTPKNVGMDVYKAVIDYWNYTDIITDVVFEERTTEYGKEQYLVSSKYNIDSYVYDLTGKMVYSANKTYVASCGDGILEIRTNPHGFSDSFFYELEYRSVSDNTEIYRVNDCSSSNMFNQGNAAIFKDYMDLIIIDSNGIPIVNKDKSTLKIEIWDNIYTSWYLGGICSEIADNNLCIVFYGPMGATYCLYNMGNNSFVNLTPSTRWFNYNGYKQVVFYGAIIIENAEKFVLRNTTTGNDVSSWYSSLHPSYNTEYFLVQNQEGRWGYIDVNGKECGFYKDAGAFVNGRALVMDDENRVFIINDSFECVSSFYSGADAVADNYILKDGKCYLVTSMFEKHVEYEYDTVDVGETVNIAGKLESVIDEKTAKQVIELTTKDLTNEQKESATGIDKMTVLAEGAVANVASTTKSEDTIHITETVVKELEPKAVETAETLEKTLTDNGVNTQRTITKTVKVKSTSSKKTVKVVKDTAETAVDTVKVETDFASVSIPASAQTEFELTEQDTNKVAVTFDTDKTTTMKISFPGVTGDTTYMAVVDETGKAIGGKYNPVTGELEAKISESGVYSVVYNEKDFEDIKDKSAEMQNAIKTLAAKGIINGTSETTFSPDASISRAEIAALIVRTLSKLDPNEDGGFVDVTKDNWFFGVAGSSRKHGIINGYEDNTFRGNNVILKEQIIAVTARVLRNEMNYKTPENVSEYLTYTDAESLPGWAKEDIALAEMANIVLQRVDGQFVPQDEMTRGDAAIILMRLFNKIW